MAGDPRFDPGSLEAWAWCGVHPDDPVARSAVTSMAEVAGIEATFGPCMNPGPGYSPAFPGIRYVDPFAYMRLVLLNAEVGMKTVVYDARVWDDDPAVRNAAYDFWWPVRQYVAAWDMGDEFDTTSLQWPILIERWNIVMSDITARSGIPPYTNMLPLAPALDAALDDLPGSDTLLSFAKYNEDKGVSLAEDYTGRTKVLMCGVNAFAHNGLVPTAESIEDDMHTLYEAGCGRFLVFGGHRVYNTDQFGTSSLTDPIGGPTDWAVAALDGSFKPDSGYVSITPARLFETRAGEGLGTIDGQFNAVGIRPAGSVTPVKIAGRGGVPADADGAVLNVTVAGAEAPGFITVFPCDGARPNAANLNYVTGSIVPNAVIAELADDGTVCVYTQATAEVVIDVNGYIPPGSRFDSIPPQRLLETRVGPGLGTADGQYNGIGEIPATATLGLPVAGRAGVPLDADAVVLNVTVTEAKGSGYITVFPCGGGRPLAASLNYRRGSTVPNAVIAKIGAGGQVCFYTQAQTHLVVDINGFYRDGRRFVAHDPARLFESRVGPGMQTTDGAQSGSGPLVLDSVTEIQVAGRAGIPGDAATAALNVTIVDARGPGFATVYPCGATRPNAANLNYNTGSTVPNAVISKIGSGGKVCVYSSNATDLVVDVNGYYPRP